MCDVVFDETNDFQVEQYDLDIIDDEEAPCDTLRRMVIGVVTAHDPIKVHDIPSSNEAPPPIQENDENQDNDQNDGDGQFQGIDQTKMIAMIKWEMRLMRMKMIQGLNHHSRRV
jgi:hypothetical protein